MTIKQINEIERGDWVGIEHHDIVLRHKFSNYFNNRFFHQVRGNIMCRAIVYQISRIFGHTYDMKFVCLCNRAFQERHKGSDPIEFYEEAEIALYRMAH